MLMLAGAHRLPGQLTSPFHSSVLLPFFSAPFSICVMTVDKPSTKVMLPTLKLAGQRNEMEGHVTTTSMPHRGPCLRALRAWTWHSG